MTQATHTGRVLYQKRIRSEAALMVTRLHGPSRGPKLEAEVRQWLAKSPEHRAAFELANEVWDKTENLPLLRSEWVTGPACIVFLYLDSIGKAADESDVEDGRRLRSRRTAGREVRYAPGLL